jgi:hypothetical protein
LKKKETVVMILLYRIKYGPSMALAFYMFWAGMFGEGIAGGFAQGCPS